MIKKTGLSLVSLALCASLSACDVVLGEAYTCEDPNSPDGYFHFAFEGAAGTSGVFSVGRGPHSREGNSWVRKARVYAREAVYIHHQKTLHWDEATQRSYPYLHVYNYRFNRETKELTLEDYREDFPDATGKGDSGKGDSERRRVHRYPCQPGVPGVPML